ncbi:MAG: hypothetical protein ACRCSK_06570 [Fusobacteriaceae bacterium]
MSGRLKKKVSITLQDTQIIAPKVKYDRQLYNCKYLVQVFLAMKNLINCTPELEQEFYSYLDDMFSNDGMEHYSNFSPLYKAIVLEHKRTNSTLELLDTMTLKKQLKECNL